MDFDHESRIFGLFEKYQLPQTIGVIPCVSTGDHHSKVTAPIKSILESDRTVKFLGEYVLRTGSEIALHGYCHQTNRLSKPTRRDYFEFQRISDSEQRDLIKKGTEILENAFGARPRTFIPPWNRNDRNTVLVCEELGYRVISAGAYTPVTDGILGFGTNSSLAEFSTSFKHAKEFDSQVFIHVLFHSATVRSADEILLLESILKTVREDPECVCMTISEVAESWPELIRLFNQAGKNVVPFAATEDGPRSRVWPYIKTVSYFRKVIPLQHSMRLAANHYWSGNYIDSVKDGILIDASCSRLLRRFRFLSVLLGFSIAIAVWIIFDARLDQKVVATALAAVLTILLGWVGGKSASSLQTGKELQFVAILVAFGILGGFFGSFIWTLM
jgi:peptidoglycan/xylan/chitin deacetylase (PgdA/CDA1 family)